MANSFCGDLFGGAQCLDDILMGPTGGNESPTSFDQQLAIAQADVDYTSGVWAQDGTSEFQFLRPGRFSDWHESDSLAILDMIANPCDHESRHPHDETSLPQSCDMFSRLSDSNLDTQGHLHGHHQMASSPAQPFVLDTDFSSQEWAVVGSSPQQAISPPEPEDVQSMTEDHASVSSEAPKPSEPAEKCYAQLLHDCFLQAPDHVMSLRAIYDWFAVNTRRGKQGGRGWQNSVRHNLSMNAAFEKVNEGLHIKSECLWRLSDTAVRAGMVYPTTRYRSASKGEVQLRCGNPAPQRQQSGSKGGQATRAQLLQRKLQRRHGSSYHNMPELARPASRPSSAPLSPFAPFSPRLVDCVEGDQGLATCSAEPAMMLSSGLLEDAVVPPSRLAIDMPDTLETTLEGADLSDVRLYTDIGADTGIPLRDSVYLNFGRFEPYSNYGQEFQCSGGWDFGGTGNALEGGPPSMTSATTSSDAELACELGLVPLWR